MQQKIAVPRNPSSLCSDRHCRMHRSADHSGTSGTGSPGCTHQALRHRQRTTWSCPPRTLVPDNNQVSVIVQEKEYDATISVVFDGGKGQYLVKSAQVTLYRSDGQVITENLGIKKGDLVKLQGTKQTDRVVAYVSEVNGETYKVADTMSQYRTR